jgi:ankyrin repeat protein
VSGGVSPLCVAAQNGRLESVKALLALGADPNHDSPSPLHYAARQGDVKVLDALLSCLADRNAVDPKDKETPLQWAVENQRVEAVRMLVAKGSDLAHKNRFGLTAMDLAKQIGNAKIISILKGGLG